MIASESNSPTASHQQSPANLTPLTPEGAVAHKARMNADLVDALKSPCPSDTIPYVTGIGLYTHVEGSPRVPLHPDGKPQPQQEFLPVPTPKNTRSRGSQLDEKVGKLWGQLEKAIEEEEEIIGTTQLGIEALRRRYGGLGPPRNSRTPVQYVQQQRDGQWGRTTDAGNMKAPANGRNQSLSGVMASLAVEKKDADVRGTEVQQGRP